MHIVNFDSTEQLEVALFDVSIIGIMRAYLKQAVEIGLVDDAEYPVSDPFKTRRDYFHRILLGHIFPYRIDKVFGEVVVNELSLCVSDKEVLLTEVEIKLKLKVW